jgi:hypothetical protein
LRLLDLRPPTLAQKLSANGANGAKGAKGANLIFYFF